MSKWNVIEADCIEAMAAMPEASVDAIVTDPPYGLGFMGKKWDGPASFVERKPARQNTFDHVGGNHNPTNSADAVRTRRVEGQKFGAWCEAWATEALRVLKPGGHLLAFGGTRTSHRMVCAIEDAGFEIRDSVLWLYGSGFPKSHNIGGGLGTALKPAHEPIVMARKPLSGTVAGNVLAHGTGALNVDGCRIEGQPREPGNLDPTANGNGITHGAMTRPANYVMPSGRWPANVLLDEEAAALLDEQTGDLPAGTYVGRNREGEKPATVYGNYGVDTDDVGYGGSGGASRFFYCAKASTEERSAGLTPTIDVGLDARNPHPTVKPIDLMRWLCRLVTPPGGTVLDPFTGSGTTGCAAVLEDFNFVGIEREAEYVAIAKARIAYWWKQPVQLDLEAA